MGVTREPVGTVQKYVDDNGVNYPIAITGSAPATAYGVTAIPHAFIVSPRGTVVFAGHPARIKDGDIEEQLKLVRLDPEWNLPAKLRSIQRLLLQKRYGSAMKSLEREAKKEGSESEAAEKTLAEVKKYGESLVKEARSIASEDGDYLYAMEQLTLVKRTFSGSEIGDQASDILKEWKSDKDVKKELTGLKYIAQAEEYIKKKKYREARGYLEAAIARAPGTMAEKKARKLLARVQ